MESITQYVEQRLKLRVSRQKSAVAPAVERPVLGFVFFRHRDARDSVTVAPNSQTSREWNPAAGHAQLGCLDDATSQLYPIRCGGGRNQTSRANRRGAVQTPPADPTLNGVGGLALEGVRRVCGSGRAVPAALRTEGGGRRDSLATIILPRRKTTR
jgi:hypothetical protein